MPNLIKEAGRFLNIEQIPNGDLVLMLTDSGKQLVAIRAAERAQVVAELEQMRQSSQTCDVNTSPMTTGSTRCGHTLPCPHHTKLGDKLGDVDLLMELMEDYLEKPWAVVDGDDVGIPTAAPMITDDATVTEIGRLVVTGYVWWHAAFEAESYFDVLARDGRVTFQFKRGRKK